MGKFTDSISKAIGNSEIFNRTADFLSDKQKKFKAEQALEAAKAKLDSLYIELGKTTYKKRPLTEGRTQTVIREEITATIAEVNQLQKNVDDLNVPPAEENTESETSDDGKTE